MNNTPIKKRGGSLRGRIYNKPKVHYYTCNKIGHQLSKCWYNDSKQVNEKANYVKKDKKEDDSILWLAQKRDRISQWLLFKLKSLFKLKIDIIILFLIFIMCQT